MQKIEVTYLQMVLIGVGVGVVLGLVPLILGIVKGKMKLAFGGFLASVAAGAAWSLLSLVVVIVFVWLILRKPPLVKPLENASLNEESGTLEVEDSNKTPENS